MINQGPHDQNPLKYNLYKNSPDKTDKELTINDAIKYSASKDFKKKVIKLDFWFSRGGKISDGKISKLLKENANNSEFIEALKKVKDHYASTKGTDSKKYKAIEEMFKIMNSSSETQESHPSKKDDEIDHKNLLKIVPKNSPKVDKPATEETKPKLEQTPLSDRKIEAQTETFKTLENFMRAGFLSKNPEQIHAQVATPQPKKEDIKKIETPHEESIVEEKPPTISDKIAGEEQKINHLRDLIKNAEEKISGAHELPPNLVSDAQAVWKKELHELKEQLVLHEKKFEQIKNIREKIAKIEKLIVGFEETKQMVSDLPDSVANLDKNITKQKAVIEKNEYKILKLLTPDINRSKEMSPTEIRAKAIEIQQKNNELKKQFEALNKTFVESKKNTPELINLHEFLTKESSSLSTENDARLALPEGRRQNEQFQIDKGTLSLNNFLYQTIDDGSKPVINPRNTNPLQEEDLYNTLSTMTTQERQEFDRTFESEASNKQSGNVEKRQILSEADFMKKFQDFVKGKEIEERKAKYEEYKMDFRQAEDQIAQNKQNVIAFMNYLKNDIDEYSEEDPNLGKIVDLDALRNKEPNIDMIKDPIKFNAVFKDFRIEENPLDDVFAPEIAARNAIEQNKQEVMDYLTNLRTQLNEADEVDGNNLYFQHSDSIDMKRFILDKDPVDLDMITDPKLFLAKFEAFKALKEIEQNKDKVLDYMNNLKDNLTNIEEDEVDLFNKTHQKYNNFFNMDQFYSIEEPNLGMIKDPVKFLENFHNEQPPN